MKPSTILAAMAASSVFFAAPGAAELPEGAQAPNFSTTAAQGGQPFAFSLRAALAKGPVVLYFYPKAFTKGCTLEARAFAENIEAFKQAGASVIGMSNDDIETLKRFSAEECRSAFPVGVASQNLLKAYDVEIEREGKGIGLAKRTSYVIAPDGRIVLVYSNMDYRDHVARTLAAVRALSQKP